MTASASGEAQSTHELQALVRWVLHSWLRPADRDSGWEQRAGHRLGLRTGASGDKPADSDAHQVSAARTQGH